MPMPLHEQTKFVFACLHGLIQAVEKETGKLGKVIATITSLVVISLARWSGGQWSALAPVSWPRTLSPLDLLLSAFRAIAFATA